MDDSNAAADDDDDDLQLEDNNDDSQQDSRSLSSRRIAFYSGQLCERGTDVAMFDYADGAETLLGLTSYVLYDATSSETFGGCVERFRKRFGERLIPCQGFAEVDTCLQRLCIPNLYLIKITDDENLSRLPGVRNLVHAVFFARAPQGNVYARISPCVPGSGPVVPHIVRPAEQGDGDGLREELGIPTSATVFGRHGGFVAFDIPFAREAIVAVATARPDIFFLLMNTPPICDPLPNIVHLPRSSDAAYKSRFIRSCDAMLHARQGGESFGLAVAEFSAHNKPVLTSSIHHDNHQADFHLTTLRAHAGCERFFYEDKLSLMRLLLGFDRDAVRTRDWNAYRAFEPSRVMRTFEQVFLSGDRDRSTDADDTHKKSYDDSTAAAVDVTDASKTAAKAAAAELMTLDRELAVLVQLPTAPERPFARPRLFVCTFAPYIMIRLAPSTSAAAAGTLQHGQKVLARAARGRWIKLVVESAAERWALTWHPLLGQLLEMSEQGSESDDDVALRMLTPGTNVVGET